MIFPREGYAMKREIVMTVLLLVAAAALTVAQQSNSPTEVNLDNVPEKYVVIKGDTLWDISERFLGDPFEWPEVWKRNEYIINPHLIFPGDTIRLKAMIKTVIEAEAPPKVEEFIEKAPAEQPKPVAQPEPVFVPAAPRISEAEKTETESFVETVPDDPNVIRKLSEPRNVFTEKIFLRTGFITQRSELPKPKITHIEEEKTSATKFDVVVINLGKNDGVREGDIYAAISVGDRVKHPETGKNLGVVVRIKGVLEVISAGEKQARCLVTENFDPMEKDDHVMPYRISSGPRFDAWVKPEVSIDGTILAIHDPMLSIHINDILYLDKGSVDGIRPGDRFVIYGRKDAANTSGQRNQLGEIQAINVMANETAVIVVSLKGEHIEVGDRVVLNARCRLIN